MSNQANIELLESIFEEVQDCFPYLDEEKQIEIANNRFLGDRPMNIGDRVQTLNTFVPITGEIVDMYKNLVTIADDDAETTDDLLSFHADDLEVIQ